MDARTPPPEVGAAPPETPGFVPAAARPALPLAPTPFVGREQQVADVRALLKRPSLRLLTLTGPGGIGKTRLALCVTEALHSEFAHGVCFVPLAALTDAGLVLPAIGKALGLWEAGGTITFSSVVANDYYLTPGPAGFEDGTVNYLSIPAVQTGLKLIESIGIDLIHTRVMCLTGWLIDRLLALRYASGNPLIRLYGPATTERRGATIQVNFLDRDGGLIDCTHVERLANVEGISLRAGRHCNPGAREIALGFTEADLAPCFREKDRLSFEQFLQVIDGKTTGALRASIGPVTTFADVYKYTRFAETFIDKADAGQSLYT